MPINCPLTFGENLECEGCRYIWGDKCSWFFPAEPINNILTTEERVARLEKGSIVPKIRYIPVEPQLTNANTARQMRQIRGEQAFMRNKLKELSQRQRRKDYV